jgi:DNA polymerase sigma
MIIKRWAKSHGLNDPSGQGGPVTFSSYALALMVIGFLQVRSCLV